MKKNNTTASLVRASRTNQGVTQAVFAAMIGKTRDDVANYETGRSSPPGDVVLRIQGLPKKRRTNKK